MLPKSIRDDLKSIGINRLFGARIDNWEYGERYKTGDYIIYCIEGKVVSIRKSKWIWRAEDSE